MKAMPITDLIQLLTEYKFGRGYGKTEIPIINQDYVERLFETYGDDYYKESSYSSYELSKSNQERIDRLSKDKEKAE
jgi:hypothetical protein